MKEITIKALKVRQPIGDFFVGVIPHDMLTEICYVDVRQIGHETELDSYIGIQRQVDKNRIEEIRSYVRSPDATFPTAVILAIDEKCIEWNEESSELKIKEYVDDEDASKNIAFDSIAKILDGQHRVKGLSEGNQYRLPLADDGHELVFDLNVSIFVGADVAEHASIFSTVNLAQTKVNKSLAYDLAELSKSRSPQKTAHNITVILDKMPASPFYQSVKRLGVATVGRGSETLTQATVVEAILPLISKQPNLDRHVLKKGERLPSPGVMDLEKVVFRNFFVEEKDSDIAKIIWSYFSAIKERWPVAWESATRGNVIRRTNGFKAFMRFLPIAYKHLNAGDFHAVVNKERFSTVFKSISITDDDFTVDNFMPGSSGESALFKRLKEETGLD